MLPPLDLMVMSGPFDGRIIRLNAPNNRNPEVGMGYIIGRRESCDLALPYDRWVSGRHARLYALDGWLLEDLRSTNYTYLATAREDGTFSGRVRVEGQVPVQIGALFLIGRVWLRLQKIG